MVLAEQRIDALLFIFFLASTDKIDKRISELTKNFYLIVSQHYQKTI